MNREVRIATRKSPLALWRTEHVAARLQYLETWLARRREGDPDAVPIPRHVERELRSYLECGRARG